NSTLIADNMILFYRFFLFFFSSRRRHTRSKRDWSSDVCSSDLIPERSRKAPHCRTGRGPWEPDDSGNRSRWCGTWDRTVWGAGQIGRASCRERVWGGGGEG